MMKVKGGTQHEPKIIKSPQGFPVAYEVDGGTLYNGFYDRDDHHHNCNGGITADYVKQCVTSVKFWVEGLIYSISVVVFIYALVMLAYAFTPEPYERGMNELRGGDYVQH